GRPRLQTNRYLLPTLRSSRWPPALSSSEQEEIAGASCPPHAGNRCLRRARLVALALPGRPGWPIQLEEVARSRVPAAAVHATDQIERLRVDVAALLVLNDRIVDVCADHATDDHRLARARHQR